MKKLVIATLAMAVLASSAFAQAEPGDVGIFADPTGTESTVSPLPFTPFNIYAIVFDAPGDVAGFEFEVRITDPTLFVNATTLNPTNAVNVGSGTNFIVGTGSCLPAAGPLTMVTLGIFPTSQTGYADVAICLGNSTPASLTPPVPAYLSCASEILPFGVAQNGNGYPDGCLIVGPTSEGPVATESASFGEMKARF